jgi:hypothetical protein
MLIMIAHCVNGALCIAAEERLARLARDHRKVEASGAVGAHAAPLDALTVRRQIGGRQHARRTTFTTSRLRHYVRALLQ